MSHWIRLANLMLDAGYLILAAHQTSSIENPRLPDGQGKMTEGNDTQASFFGCAARNILRLSLRQAQGRL